MDLSSALVMSLHRGAATAAAVKAPSPPPVCPVVAAVAHDPYSLLFHGHFHAGMQSASSGWQSGIRSLVRFGGGDSGDARNLQRMPLGLAALFKDCGRDTHECVSAGCARVSPWRKRPPSAAPAES